MSSARKRKAAPPGSSAPAAGAAGARAGRACRTPPLWRVSEAKLACCDLDAVRRCMLLTDDDAVIIIVVVVIVVEMNAERCVRYGVRACLAE